MKSYVFNLNCSVLKLRNQPLKWQKIGENEIVRKTISLEAVLWCSNLSDYDIITIKIKMDCQ